MNLLHLVFLVVSGYLAQADPDTYYSTGSTIYCGKGYWQFGQNCFMIHSGPESWEQASSNCMRNGQQLLEIKSGNEYAALVSKLRKAGLDKQSYWLGIHLSDDTYQYRSNGGYGIPDTFWNGYAQDNSQFRASRIATKGKSYCAYLNQQLFLYHSTQDCNAKLSYICESQGRPSPTPLVPHRSRCPHNWSYDGQRRKCYFVSEPGRSLSHYGAISYCRQNQGNLLRYEGIPSPVLEGILSDWQGTYFFIFNSEPFGCKAITWKHHQISDNIYVHCEAKLRFICERNP